MNQEQLCSELLKLGFKEYQGPQSDEQVRYFTKDRVEGTECLTNELRPAFELVVYPLREFDMSIHGSAAFKIYGEVCKGVWTELSLYAVPYNRVVELFEKAYSALGRCWMSACEVLR